MSRQAYKWSRWLKTAPPAIERWQHGSMYYKDTRLTRTKRPARKSESTEENVCEAEFQKIIDNTIKYMDSRFMNLSEKPLCCFKVLDPSTLPHAREDLANYGGEEVDYLIAHFANLLTEEEKEKIPQEWAYLKMWLSELA